MLGRTLAIPFDGESFIHRDAPAGQIQVCKIALGGDAAAVYGFTIQLESLAIILIHTETEFIQYPEAPLALRTPLLCRLPIQRGGFLEGLRDSHAILIPHTESHVGITLGRRRCPTSDSRHQ